MAWGLSKDNASLSSATCPQPAGPMALPRLSWGQDEQTGTAAGRPLRSLNPHSTVPAGSGSVAVSPSAPRLAHSHREQHMVPGALWAPTRAPFKAGLFKEVLDTA